MNKLLYIYILLQFSIKTFAQINVISGTNGSLTISPTGIRSKLPVSNFTNANITMGEGALANNLYGTRNIAIGYQALFTQSFTNINSEFASENVAIGYAVLKNNQPTSLLNGHNNVAVGTFALTDNTTGGFNAAFGDRALLKNTTGSKNTAIGPLSLSNSTIGSSNVAIGISALYENTTGLQNTASGSYSLFNNTTGQSNTVVGYSAGYSNISGFRNVFIGYNAGYNHDADDLLVIENSDANRALIRGNFADDKVGINILNTDLNTNIATFQVNGTASNTAGGNWLVNSDKRLKKNISSLNSQEMLQKVLRLQGVNYEWNDGDTGKIRPTGIQFGFIAQELQEVFPTKVKSDTNGLLSATYGDFDPMIIESIKALKALIDEQRKMIEVQNQKINTLESKLANTNQVDSKVQNTKK